MADFLAYFCSAVSVGLVFAMPHAAFKGNGRVWFFEFAALTGALVALAGVQYPGRGAVAFAFIAAAFGVATLAVSVIMGLLGLYLRRTLMTSDANFEE